MAASKSDSACISSVCRMPRTSANKTAQIRIRDLEEEPKVVVGNLA
jgi:hypothetical protein